MSLSPGPIFEMGARATQRMELVQNGPAHSAEIIRAFFFVTTTTSPTLI